MTILAMFSGGLDSTAMLVRLLQDTEDELRVHHVHLVNRENRAGAEQKAVADIVNYCGKNYRPFQFSESVLDFKGLEAVPIDYIAIAYVACQVAIDTPGCHRIAVGTLAVDTDEINRSSRQRQVFNTMYECYRARKLGEPDMQWIYPVHHCSKIDLAAMLPAELLQKTWSCRTPQVTETGYQPCGSCKACRARQGVDKNKHPDISGRPNDSYVA